MTQGIRSALRKQPYEILTANSAKAALAILAETGIDVVVSDERMPEMGGSQLLSLVRQHHPDTVRIILTGQASLNAAVDAINQAEIYRFLVKPCPPAALALCVEQAIEVKEQRQSLREKLSARDVNGLSQLTSTFERGLGSLWMAFQPVVSVSQERTFGFEALVRTDEPAITGPLRLFDIAEELDRLWDLERLIRKSVAEAAACAPEETIFLVNVHPRSLEDPLLWSDEEPLRRLATRTILEITERASIQDIAEAHKKIAVLRESGYRIAVDDLGAGYAGLTSFALLSPDFVKFDMSLVRDIHTSPTKTKLLSSLTALCKELRIRPIGEGVETVEERDRLIEVGFDLLQGYHFAHPKKIWGRRLNS